MVATKKSTSRYKKCPICKRVGKYTIEENYIICKCGHDLMEYKENA